MAEMVDARDLKSLGFCPCRFKSGSRHHVISGLFSSSVEVCSRVGGDNLCPVKAVYVHYEANENRCDMSADVRPYNNS